jgi:NAD(P)H-dependent FMN reductase
LGSVRAGRICPQVARWVAQCVPQDVDFELETVDLRDYHLPYDDESALPAHVKDGAYEQPHTRAWSAKVASASGFVLLTPQYNWSFPAILKNAIDHLYHEWSGKPAVIVSYGSRGGGKAAGHLRQVLDGLRMRAVATMPALPLAGKPMVDGQLADPGAAFADCVPALEAAFRELGAELRAPVGTPSA